MAENRTYIPAFKAHVGDWEYFTCLMTYGEVARQVGFAYELGGNKDLATMIQRGLSGRTNEITRYLLESEHRFLGSLVVAAWGGKPEFRNLSIEKPADIIEGIDADFGLLIFDGSQQYFALDGQHRLRAIKDAIRKKPELSHEDISVLLVTHFDTDEGQERTRRLFTNINRNAQKTTPSENIALDEDDGFAIITRELIRSHPFLGREGVVRVFIRDLGEGGELTLAQSSVPVTNPHAWTTITVLYEMLKALAFDIEPSLYDTATRPSDDVLSAAAEILSGRINSLLKACDDLAANLPAGKNARDVRAPKGSEGRGHPMMRPVIQRAVADVIGDAVEAEKLDWEEAFTRLSALPWRLDAAPWTAVFNLETKRMITGKDNTNLLRKLLMVHLCPDSKEEIRRARREYKALIGSTYILSEEELSSNIAKDPES